MVIRLCYSFVMTKIPYKTLDSYCTGTGVSVAFLARKLDITREYLSAIRHMHKFPSRNLAIQIENLTGIPKYNLLYPEEFN